MKNLLLIFPISLYLSIAALAHEKYPKLKNDLLQECHDSKEFAKKLKGMKVVCGSDYHHFNSRAWRTKYTRSKRNIKIAEFNVLHPGMGKTRFKDYKRVAQLINKYDVVGVTELIPLTKEDRELNQKIKNFLAVTPLEIDETKDKVALLKKQIKASTRSTLTKERELQALEKKIIKLEKDLKEVTKLYRQPGYLNILDELNKLSRKKEWALILSSQPEGSKGAKTFEVVGYYYRASKVKPKTNSYCKKIATSRNKKSACIIEMSAEDLGEDKADIFSKKPFMAEFQSGKFTFALVTSHIVFNPPLDSKQAANIALKAFGVSDYSQIGAGADRMKFARFAETKVTLDFIRNYLKTRGSQKDLIFMGDFNLESSNPYWDTVLKSWPGAKLFIEGKTSLSSPRFLKDGTETNAKASNYDHFIFDPKVTKECIINGKFKGGVEDFTAGHFGHYLNRAYNIRLADLSKAGNEYNIDPAKEKSILEKYVDPYHKKDLIRTLGKVSTFSDDGKKKVSFEGILKDDNATLKYITKFQERVLDSQKTDKEFYYFYEQLVSDHYPIYMECDI